MLRTLSTTCLISLFVGTHAWAQGDTAPQETSTAEAPAESTESATPATEATESAQEDAAAPEAPTAEAGEPTEAATPEAGQPPIRRPLRKQRPTEKSKNRTLLKAI